MTRSGIIEDLQTANAHRGVAAFGAALGGFPPVCAYVLTHYALPALWRSADQLERWRFWALVPVVLACLMFSVRTVWQWGTRSFDDDLKAGCLVLALEGVMVLAPIPALCLVALSGLILINAVATACILVAEDVPEQKPTVTSVSRELNVPRRVAAQVVDKQRASAPQPRPRPA